VDTALDALFKMPFAEEWQNLDTPKARWLTSIYWILFLILSVLLLNLLIAIVTQGEKEKNKERRSTSLLSIFVFFTNHALSISRYMGRWMDLISLLFLVFYWSFLVVIGRFLSLPLETGVVGGCLESDDHGHDAIEFTKPKQQTGCQREQKREKTQVKVQWFHRCYAA